MRSSEARDWRSHLQPSEEQFLVRTAQEIAVLVQNQMKMRRFRTRLTEFAEKWTAYRTAYEAERAGKWQPEMGTPENPLGTIWPFVYVDQRPGCFPRYPNDAPEILGDYTLLGVIHDQVPAQCERINDGCLPHDLEEIIWVNLVTGRCEESRGIDTRPGVLTAPKSTIPQARILQCRDRVKADLAQADEKPNGRGQPKGLAQSGYDVFLSHNSKDKAAVEEIAKRLKSVGIRPWFDKWDLAGGDTIADALEKAITSINCAVIFFGPADKGNWHLMEIRAYVDAWAKKQARLIPVILPDAPETPSLPIWLKQALWVNMHEWKKAGNDAFYQLICGILGRPPGDSPRLRVTRRDVDKWRNECRQKDKDRMG